MVVGEMVVMEVMMVEVEVGEEWGLERWWWWRLKLEESGGWGDGGDGGDDGGGGGWGRVVVGENSQPLTVSHHLEYRNAHSIE